jgi:hypothetical protein
MRIVVVGLWRMWESQSDSQGLWEAFFAFQQSVISTGIQRPAVCVVYNPQPHRVRPISDIKTSPALEFDFQSEWPVISGRLPSRWNPPARPIWITMWS